MGRAAELARLWCSPRPISYAGPFEWQFALPVRRAVAVEWRHIE